MLEKANDKGTNTAVPITNQAPNYGAQGVFINSPVTFPAALPPSPVLHQLRAPVSDFVGREQELDQLLLALRQAVWQLLSVAFAGWVGSARLN